MNAEGIDANTNIKKDLPGTYFLRTTEDEKFDINEYIYNSLDLNVDNVQSSSNDDEFDLEKIKRAALKDSEINASSLRSEQINSFPEIDLLVLGENRLDSTDNIEENLLIKMNKQINKQETSSKSYKDNLVTLVTEHKQEKIDTENNQETLEIESPDYEPMSPPINEQKNINKTDFVFAGKDKILKNNTDMKSNELKNSRQINEKPFETVSICKNNILFKNDLENFGISSLPSPFLSSFTPPVSPLTIFKFEESTEKIEHCFDGDFFVDDDINSFPEEEICTDGCDSNIENENTDLIFSGNGGILNQNLSETVFQEETSQNTIMNDHNYFNQEQNVCSFDSYLKQTHTLNNCLNILIKNFINYKQNPEFYDKKKYVEEKIEEITSKIMTLRKSFDAVFLQKSVNFVNTDLGSPCFQENENKSFLIQHNDSLNTKFDDVKFQFDSAISEALKKVEECGHKDMSKSDQSEIKLRGEEELINICIYKESDTVDQIIHNQTVPFEVNNLDKNCFYNGSQKNENFFFEEGSEERPFTKYKTLVMLAKTIVDFSNKTTSITNFDEFFEATVRDFKQIMIHPNMTDNFVQTDYTGKIYSERRLKSINEKAKRRLLNDSSDSSDISSEYESDNLVNELEKTEISLNNDEQENILNGIDFSKYLDSSNDESENFPNDFSEHLDVILEEGDESDTLKAINNNTADKCIDVLSENSSIGKGESYAQSVSNNSYNKHELSNKNCNAEEKENVSTGNCYVDKEIERLLDFKSLVFKRFPLNYRNANNDKKQTTKKIKVSNITQILREDQGKDSSQGSESEEEDCLANEKNFLVRQNEHFKKQLLASSCSSESENDSDILLQDEDEIDDDDEDNLNKNKPTLVEKFLENYIENNEQIEENNNNKLNKEDFSVFDDIKDRREKHDQLNSINKFEELEMKHKSDDKDNDLQDDNSDKQNDESSDCEFSGKSLDINHKNKKRKSLDTLLVEDQKRRKNLKFSDEIVSLSSDDESDLEDLKIKKTEPHRIIRPIMKTEQLTSETKKAQKEEQSRLNRLKKKENILKKAYKEHNRDPSDIRELVLDYNCTTKKFITVYKELVSHLKQHQIDGVKFMYDCCYGSVNFVEEFPGSGCILAHCMGLGKTLQLITLIHTLITHEDLKTSRILILCPKSTVMNWAEEIHRWLGPLGVKNMKVFTFNDVSDITEKMNVLQEWHSCGPTKSYSSGCLLVGYEAFRTLVSYPNKKNRNLKLDLEEIKSIIKKTLLDPGADLVVCDEGHIIKNRRAAISQAVTEIRTPRRIVLTGTPIQNNLKEYYSMVNFIKPSYLGTEKEFANVYANPIKNGQHKDSSKRDIKIMKQRSFVLHSKLSSFVQRREAALLKTFLPQKFEYVLFIPMTPVQVKLYEIFLEAVGKREDTDKKGRNLLTDYTCLRKIWTHPKVLENAYNNAIILKNKKEKKMSGMEVASDEDQPDDIYDSQTGLMSVTSDWWRQYLTPPDLKSILPSNKLLTMFEILRMCAENREKCLIFSAFVAVLNVVEFFMKLINEKNVEDAKEFGIDRFNGPWVNGKDYYRLDGKTPKTLRHEMVKSFNDPNNERARVFLISAKAGGQGINLIGANRVVILDTSWNPSNDQQNIFRIFRLGQKRNCYIYRLISSGTMEEKVYSRSVTKQAMSFRVMDEHQIDRHYSMAELAELYTLTKPDYSNRAIPNLPQDNILAHLLRNFHKYVFKYHEHDSLLENKIEQELSEQEKEDAWQAYENEINSVVNAVLPNLQGLELFGGISMNNSLHNLDNFNRLPSSSAIFNQGRAGITSPHFLPGYNFSSKNYLDMFPYFSNTNSLYDLTKNPTYADTINSNFLSPNNRPPASNIDLTLPPVSSPNYASLDNLHIPASLSSTYSSSLAQYNALYSTGSGMLSSPLSRFNNSNLENFKRYYDNFVNSSTIPSGIVSSNQSKNHSNVEIRPKIVDLSNNIANNEIGSLRKNSLHPNFSASLATSSSGSMTSSILNAQNRLINQSSNNDLNLSTKKNVGSSIANIQKESRNQQNGGTSKPSKQSPAYKNNVNSFTTMSKLSNHSVKSIKTITSDITKTETLPISNHGKTNETIQKTRFYNSNDAIEDSCERTSNKAKQAPPEKSNVGKNLQTLLTQTPNIKSSSKTLSNKMSNIIQVQGVSNNTAQLTKVLSKQQLNLVKSKTSLPNSSSLKDSGKFLSQHFNSLNRGTNSPTSIEMRRKTSDISNMTKSKLISSSLIINNKEHNDQKSQNLNFTNSSGLSKYSKLMMDPLSSNVEDKLLGAGISISKKSSNTKIGINITNPTGNMNSNTASNIQASSIQRKRSLNQENNNRLGSSFLNKFDPNPKKSKLTPKELAEELSTSLKRIQSSKGLTIVHKNANKGTSSSSDILEVD